MYKYRKLIMEGKISLPIKDAKKIIGPDCAYRLYNDIKSKNVDENSDF